jgi:murein DD-endopeptidase MepM/ murein hydrolase activator NlpD
MRVKGLIFLVVLVFLCTALGNSYVRYLVKPGDKLFNIIRDYNIRISTILDFNCIDDPRCLESGQAIYIPVRDGFFYDVQDGDSPEYIAKLFFALVEDIMSANRLSYSSKIYTGQRLFIPLEAVSVCSNVNISTQYSWPVYGKISSEFGWRKDPFTGASTFHSGMDIAVQQGAPVFAARDGTVIEAADNGGYGLNIIILHADGSRTRYAHLSHISVYSGQRVVRGELIGRVGETGRATGPHLHFEIVDSRNQCKDPRSYLSSSQYMYVRKESGSLGLGGK